MKTVSLCQVSVMMRSNLPDALNYTTYINRINEVFKCKDFRIFEPFPKDQWDKLPNELPKAIGQSGSVDVQFSPVAFNLILKRFDEDWEKQLDIAMKALDEIFTDIGKEFNMLYRLGFIITINCEKNNLIENAKQILNQDITEKKEWKIAYLDSLVENDLQMNKWTRYEFNEEQGLYHYVLDINTKAQNNFALREDKIFTLYEIMKTKLVGAYNEFR